MSNTLNLTTTEPLVNTTLHVDINSYFATILQQENPMLRGKPVGILKGAGRSCIIAASKEAKKCGVKTGSRLKEALQLCPQLITLPAEFARYLDATKRLQAVFQQFSPDVFIYSLDEAFLNLSSCQRYLYPEISITGQAIQEAIKAELGQWVSCNVGVAPNRFLAKLASETAPTGTVQVVRTETLDLLLATTPFKSVCGVGHRLEEKLSRLGITNLYQLRFFKAEDLTPVVGQFWAGELLKMAYGQETHLLAQLDHPPAHMKSVGRSITGFHLHNSEDEIKAVILNLIEEVTHKVRKMKLAGRYVWIKLYGSAPHERWLAHQTLSYHIRHTKEMFDILYHQHYRHWQRSFKVIKFAVSLGLLEPLATTPQSLLPAWQTQDRISAAVDALSDRYGLFTVRSGLLTSRDIIKPEVTGFLGDREYQLEHT